ncbi:uncharacterized protein BHQ10_007437 [Talaromyces amestolkiae]|uniref:Alcohol dehydrogenase-like N-terminal domain-containing protein n=1 Tax=Talaromyces amestolkiae TaxID=1196081 RepID=A0A364L6I2_TALAM|nr:uncharacterized protein BHQ10_007437 [Talaromyces amestolkiae]RAO71425.1 hypothetical protein BHQ10_007437 [Talaromyces amestolkiae]
MAAQTQKAIFVREVGEPLVSGERPIPKPPKGYILVKVLSAMLLPHDTYGRDWGLLIEERLPYVPSANIGGVVEKLGDGVTSFSIGDEIFGQGDPMYPTPDSAGLQEYAILDADAVARVPEGVAMDDAVTFPVNATTSFEALFHPENGFGFPAPLPKDQKSSSHEANIDLQAQTIVIIGGGSSVGRLGIQFARLASIGRIITVASIRNEAELRTLGATHVVDRHDTQDSIAKKIHGIVPCDYITHVYDCVSWDPSLSLLIVSRTKESTILTLHPFDLGITQEQGLEKCQVRHLFGQNQFLRPMLKPFWENLPQWIEEGTLVTRRHRVIEGLDLVKIESALDDYRDGSAVLQAVVHPWGKPWLF